MSETLKKRYGQYGISKSLQPSVIAKRCSAIMVKIFQESIFWDFFVP